MHRVLTLRIILHVCVTLSCWWYIVIRSTWMNGTCIYGVATYRRTLFSDYLCYWCYCNTCECMENVNEEIIAWYFLYVLILDTFSVSPPIGQLYSVIIDECWFYLNIRKLWKISTKTVWTCHMDALKALPVARQCPAVNRMITTVCGDILTRPWETHLQI